MGLFSARAYARDRIGAEVALARNELVEVLRKRVVLSVRPDEAQRVVDGTL